jgi:uncharacterized protein YodC (DUF2158 family)
MTGSPQYSAGHVVRCAWGGPDLTVLVVIRGREYHAYITQWWDRGRHYTATLPEYLLEWVKP